MMKTKSTNEDARIYRERTELHKRLGDEIKYRVGYLGGGDFIVHVMGIDPAMDRSVAAMEDMEVCDGCD
jgi:hypothetical protein